MQTLENLILKIAGFRSLIVLVVCFGVFANLILPDAEKHINRLSGAEIGVLDLKSGLHPGEVYQTVAQYSPEAIKYYRAVELTADVIYPLIYTLLWAVALYLIYVTGNVKQPFGRVYLLPFATMLFDYAENLFVITILTLYPKEINFLAYTCSAFTFLKWASLTIITFLLLYGLLMLLLKKLGAGKV